MLGNGYLHVQNSKMTIQVHMYQLCEYKRMIHQAMHNILHEETSLYQLFVGLNLYQLNRPFELCHCSPIYGNLYYQTLHQFIFLENCWLVFFPVIQYFTKYILFPEFHKNFAH